MTRAGRVFLISWPMVGSGATSQICPRRGRLSSVEALPCLAIHGQPLAGSLFCEVAVAESGMLQPFPECVGTMRRNIGLDGLIDETAHLAGLCCPLDCPLGFFLQDDVDALGHGMG